MLVGHSLAHVVDVMITVDLTSLERVETSRPVPLVYSVHELVEKIGRTSTVYQSPLDNCLQHCVRRADYSAPSVYFGVCQRGTPPDERDILEFLIFRELDSQPSGLTWLSRRGQEL